MEVVENELNKELARPEGFEPPTLCSGGTRSIHLSYGRNPKINGVERLYYVLLVSRNELESDTGKGENRKGKRENGDGCGDEERLHHGLMNFRST